MTRDRNSLSPQQGFSRKGSSPLNSARHSMVGGLCLKMLEACWANGAGNNPLSHCKQIPTSTISNRPSRSPTSVSCTSPTSEVRALRMPGTVAACHELLRAAVGGVSTPRNIIHRPELDCCYHFSSTVLGVRNTNPPQTGMEIMQPDICCRVASLEAPENDDQLCLGHAVISSKVLQTRISKQSFVLPLEYCTLSHPSRSWTTSCLPLPH